MPPASHSPALSCSADSSGATLAAGVTQPGLDSSGRGSGIQTSDHLKKCSIPLAHTWGKCHCYVFEERENGGDGLSYCGKHKTVVAIDLTEAEAIALQVGEASAVLENR